MNIATSIVDFLGNIKPEKLFLSLAITFGFLSLLLVPVFTVPDEGVHFWASYGSFSRTIPNDLLISPQAILKKIENKSYYHDIYVKKVNFEDNTLSFGPKTITVNNANDRKVKSWEIKSSLTDITHIPQSIGVFIGKYIYGSVGSMILFGRLINMAVFILIIYFVIKYTKKWKLVILYISLFPMMVQQMASLSYDAVNFAIITSWIVLVLNIAYANIRITRRVILLSVSIAVLLCLTKPINLVLLLLLPITVYKKLQNSKNKKITEAMSRAEQFFKKNKKHIILYSILIAAIIFFTVTLAKHQAALKTLKIVVNTFFRPEINTQLDPIVFSGIVGHFGWLWYKLPVWMVFMSLSMLCIVLIKDSARFIKRDKYISYIFTGTFLAYIVGMFAAMYLLWTRLPFIGGVDAVYIQGVQGRYITPVLILLIPLFSFIASYVEIKLSYKKVQALLAIVTIFTLSTYLFLTYLFYYTASYGIKNSLI